MSDNLRAKIKDLSEKIKAAKKELDTLPKHRNKEENRRFVTLGSNLAKWQGEINNYIQMLEKRK